MPFFYALTTYFLVALGCVLYNLAARATGGIRIEIAHNTNHTVGESALKMRKAAGPRNRARANFRERELLVEYFKSGERVGPSNCRTGRWT